MTFDDLISVPPSFEFWKEKKLGFSSIKIFYYKKDNMILKTSFYEKAYCKKMFDEKTGNGWAIFVEVDFSVKIALMKNFVVLGESEMIIAKSSHKWV